MYAGLELLLGGSNSIQNFHFQESIPLNLKTGLIFSL